MATKWDSRAGHALAIKDGFPDSAVIGVEPDTANDFQLSLAAGERVRVELPTGICDGLLSCAGALKPELDSTPPSPL